MFFINICTTVLNKRLFGSQQHCTCRYIKALHIIAVFTHNQDDNSHVYVYY